MSKWTPADRPEFSSLPLAVKLGPGLDDLVDHLALGAHGEPDQIEFGADHGAHHLAVGGVMRGLEHVLGIDRGRDVARQRPLERAGERGAVGAIDQNRLADQRQIFRAGAVAIGLADAFGKRRGNAAGEEGSDVELLPRFEIEPEPTAILVSNCMIGLRR